jgi:hypothetical protein
MGDQPRRHHFVPQFYLAGFTKTASTDGGLYVLDQKQLRTWKSSPKQAAHQRDFHAIDAGPSGDPMAVEKALSTLEGQWSSVVRRVIQDQTIPKDEAFGDLMVFVAFMAVRVKRIREVLSGFIDRVSKAEVFATLATEEGRASFRQVIESQGQKLSDEEFEQLIAFCQSGQFDVDYEQTWHVQKIIEMSATLAPVLSQRIWALWIAEVDSPDLICSESPVAPTWYLPVRGPYSPAFGTPNTIVSIPLNRRVALVSMIESQLPNKRLDRAGVAAVNSATGMYANQLYSAEADFVWAMSDHQVGNVNDLLTSLRGKQ